MPPVCVVIGPGLDDRTGSAVAGQFQIGEAQMMGATVDPLDDRITGPLELVLQPALDEAAHHGIARLSIVDREPGYIRLMSGGGHRPVHRLDDVAAHTEVTQGLFQPRLQGPARRSDTLDEAEAFELRGASEQRAAQFRVLASAARTKIGDAAALVGDVAQRSIQAGPALGLDLPLQGVPDGLFVARPKLERDAFLRPAAKTAADIVAADHQILAIIGAATDEHMDVWVVGVPVIHRHPIDPRAEVPLGRRSSPPA